MARMSRQVPVDFSHFGVTSVLERLLTLTSDIEEELSGGGIEDERFFGYENRFFII